MIFFQDTLRPVQRLSCVTTIIWTREAYFKLLTLSVSFFAWFVAIQFGWTRTSFGIVVSICYCYTSQVQHLNLEITIFCTVFIFSACEIQNGFMLMEKRDQAQPECAEITSTGVPRFTKPDETPAKKLSAAGIELVTRCQYCATDNREATVNRRSWRLSLTRKHFRSISCFATCSTFTLQSHITVVPACNQCSTAPNLESQNQQLRNLRFPQRYCFAG